MRKPLTTLLAVAILGCTSQPQPAAAQTPRQKYLTQEELKALLSKKLTVRVTGAARPSTAPRSGTSVFEPDGTARFFEGNATLIGSWRIVPRSQRSCCSKCRYGNSACGSAWRECGVLATDASCL